MPGDLPLMFLSQSAIRSGSADALGNEMSRFFPRLWEIAVSRPVQSFFRQTSAHIDAKNPLTIRKDCNESGSKARNELSIAIDA